MAKITSAVCLLLFHVCSVAYGFRVLGMFPFFAKSHHQLHNSFMKTLALAGHEVVVYTPFPVKNPPPNFTNVFLDTVEIENPANINWFIDITKMPRWQCTDHFYLLSDILYRDFIESPQIQQLMVSNEKFDLVVTESYTAGQEFEMILGHIFRAPVISLQTFATNNVVNYISGNSLSIAYIPEICTAFSNKMTFFERLQNLIYITRNLYYMYYDKVVPKVENKMRVHFPKMPPLIDLIDNVSLIFVNDHLTADPTHPRTPNIIPVGGLHIEVEKPTPMSNKLKKFMDEATHGVILFSLGTYVRDELNPKDYFEMYIRVFRQLKQRVLWKTRNQNFENLPDNVMTASWVPQKEFLAHPKAVLFITHGGQFSKLEAIYYGVPVVCIPQFWDQQRNGKFYEESGVGAYLEVYDLSERNIMNAIHKVLDNPTYRNNMQRLSGIFRDRQVSAMETVVFWSEYVVRHHGAAHLKPASTQMSWYQLYLLDVIAVIIAAIVFVFTVLYFILRKIIVVLLIRSKSKNKFKSS